MPKFHCNPSSVTPALLHLQLRQHLPYSNFSPYCLPCPTAAQTPVPPQLARPTATTVTPSWAQRGPYSTSSPHYCPPAAVPAPKGPLLLPQPFCPPNPTVPPALLSPQPYCTPALLFLPVLTLKILLLQPQPYC